MRNFIQVMFVAAVCGVALAAPTPETSGHNRRAPGKTSGAGPTPRAIEVRTVTINHRWAPESASGPAPSPLEARAVTKNHRRAPESQSASTPASSSQEAAAAHSRSHQARATQAAEGEYTACCQG
ncbi:hypothetical protein CTheo_8184 [Ceratobasidium theobromae]|uniref:Effector protein n=1 Tax=Ceratobasidium theobromae TaxID=1582974 RepID=A0A5N5QAE6_9AGAM|nr:hypothetical protein CTheo_8184 [Ceratobasidium theobromae]